MYYREYAPWEQYPKTLKHEEITNPLGVFKDFFSSGKITEQLKDLKRWRKCVVSKKRYHNKKHSAADLVFFHELNLKLLEAAYLLLIEYQQNSFRVQPISSEQLTEEKETMVYFPKSLSDVEQQTPHLTLKKIFKKISPQMYRDYLAEWLFSAFRRKAIDESMTPGEVIILYENLQRLYDAAWLIDQRNNKQQEQE